MDLELIKQKSCTHYLHSIQAVQDQKKSNKRFSFFKSPFRNERTASLAVNEAKNTWFDYGAGFGGDVIKLVMLCENIEFKEAINKLSNDFIISRPIFTKVPNSVEILDVRELSNPFLINYLKSRCIDIDIARKYLKELLFSLKDKQQYALGFKNDKGGFEIRNKYLKIATSPKYITTIRNNSDMVNVFEGFMDFLSAMTYFKTEPKTDIIVLNSVSFIKEVPKYDHVQFWGDNDKAGDRCLEELNAKDCRRVFAGYKDFNEFLIANKPKPEF